MTRPITFAFVFCSISITSRDRVLQEVIGPPNPSEQRLRSWESFKWASPSLRK